MSASLTTIQSTPLDPASLMILLLTSSQLCRGRPRGLLLSGFNNLNPVFLILPMRATCTVHLIPRCYIILTPCVKNILWSLSLPSVPNFPMCPPHQTQCSQHPVLTVAYLSRCDASHTNPCSGVYSLRTETDVAYVGFQLILGWATTILLAPLSLWSVSYNGCTGHSTRFV